MVLLLTECNNNKAKTLTTLVRSVTVLFIILPILFLYLNTVTVTAGTFEP